ncbi:copper homeostasis protein CutC [Terriglobus roseus]|uniref:PF03932 family protein CutC n=1 Tax=Terriglobus roseus TaxID=392734 RepID=A0A1H4JQD2_9BACT|nr:copper homeostasis protein CutC [Terriglobus roseus]SEB48463.1 copper homeostasis protein [Terriglobus roseus]
MRELEICVETLQACEAAEAGGADRIELCAALSEGGVTPGPGFLREALASVDLPIHVLIRPRSGDFHYSEAEFRMICTDIETAMTAGAAGIVVGMLTADRQVDRVRMLEVMRLAKRRSVTFHRAFDQSNDLPVSLDVLIDLGCSRILTSGGRPTVTEGRESLARLAQQAAGRLRVAAGGGVTLENASSLTAIPGLDLHASLRPKSAPVVGDVLWQPATGNISVDAVRTLSSIVHASSDSLVR